MVGKYLTIGLLACIAVCGCSASERSAGSNHDTTTSTTTPSDPPAGDITLSDCTNLGVSVNFHNHTARPATYRVVVTMKDPGGAIVNHVEVSEPDVAPGTTEVAGAGRGLLFTGTTLPNVRPKCVISSVTRTPL